MLKVTNISPHEAEDIFKENPNIFCPIEQSKHWSTFDSFFPYRSTVGIFKYEKNNKIIAVASIAHYANKMRNSMVITRGPVWIVEPNPLMEVELINSIIAQAKNYKQPTLFVRMQVRFPSYHKGVFETFEDAFYDNYISVDIKKEEKDLLKSFSSTARNSINKARKLGITVQQVSTEEVKYYFNKKLNSITKETTQRNGFRGFNKDIYINMATKMSDVARLYVAAYKEKPVCWLISTEYNKEAIYYFAAGNDIARKLKANFLMQYTCMLDAASRGNEKWNMTGVKSKRYPALEKVTIFKQHFNKKIAIGPTTYDIPLNIIKYKLITSIISTRRKIFYGGSY